jgi:hypothetical protein
MLLAPAATASGATMRRLVSVVEPAPVRVKAGMLGRPCRGAFGLADEYVQVAQSSPPVRETPAGSSRLAGLLAEPQR